MGFYIAVVFITALLAPYIVLPETAIESTQETRWEVFKKYFQAMFMSWITVALSAYFLLPPEKVAFNHQAECFQKLVFSRSCLDLLTQSNATLAAQFDRA